MEMGGLTCVTSKSSFFAALTIGSKNGLPLINPFKPSGTSSGIYKLAVVVWIEASTLEREKFARLPPVEELRTSRRYLQLRTPPYGVSVWLVTWVGIFISHIVFEAMATYVGQVSVLSIIALFGATTPGIITTVRKAVTLLLSYVIFTKPMTNQHGAGLLLVSMGIIVKMVSENQISSWSSVLVTEAALISVQGKRLIAQILLQKVSRKLGAWQL
ncbi:hypothetical protein F8388_004110 [Cannabis sativa]|uniref:Uncharacterized protein n=1 Tax=Cannabis sativa TaxID=3483 RepID=A0A7J6FSU7_CANSA|nr:hypothetical protein F8388_004110 [Cannabis sativa]